MQNCQVFCEIKNIRSVYIRIVIWIQIWNTGRCGSRVLTCVSLPNPYYVDELRPLTGLDDRVFNYVMDCDIARTFADKLEDMVNFLIPNYVKEGKTNLVLSQLDAQAASIVPSRWQENFIPDCLEIQNTDSGWNTEMHRKTDWSENRKDDKGEMLFQGW